MVSTLGHNQPTADDTTARPAWPQHARDGVVDVRDDPSLPYTRHDEEHHTHRRGLRARRTMGWVLAAVILAAVVIVAALNRVGEVGIDFGFDDGALPLWSIIAGSAAFGFVAGRLLDDGC